MTQMIPVSVEKVQKKNRINIYLHHYICSSIHDVCKVYYNTSFIHFSTSPPKFFVFSNIFK